MRRVGHSIRRVLCLVPCRVAEAAGGDDVRGHILAAIASGLDMLAGALKPRGQTGRNLIAHDELLGTGVPHRHLAIVAAPILTSGRLDSEFLECIFWHESTSFASLLKRTCNDPYGSSLNWEDLSSHKTTYMK